MATWDLNGTLATATLGEYQISVDAALPTSGVAWSTADRKGFQGTTLQFRPPVSARAAPVLVDLYVRGSDLVATYEELSGAAVQPQLYWRLLEHPAMKAIGVQLLISMQTSLLNSEPRCTIVSELPEARTAIWNWKEKTWWGSDKDQQGFDLRSDPSAGGFVTWFSTQQEPNSYVEVIYPDDRVTQKITLGRSEACFFSEPLEKGVIRRGRIAGWLVPNAKLMESKVEPLRLFELAQKEALPLTT
ncbi:hypothetical protein [Anatilimnocola floriformis]|uniref:hypothetical protein n=1 Tax=Anatilimnocola floriformis TaxID=2948575 RepID=UPI0020C2C801|nr:hypothetical protein [Anatilimnocola floriformis]